MIVLDTHAWLWWVDAPDRLGAGARGAIEAAEAVGISTFSCWEIVTLARRGRLRLDREIVTWVRQALAQPGTQALPLTPEIAVRAAALDQTLFPADPADRIIYATATTHGVPLVTRDAAIAGFDAARTVWD